MSKRLNRSASTLRESLSGAILNGVPYDPDQCAFTPRQKEIGIIDRPEVREDACIRDRIAGIEKTLMCCLGISEDLANRIGTGMTRDDNEKRVACMTVSSYLDSIEQIACDIRVLLDRTRSAL